jgi:Matrixin
MEVPMMRVMRHTTPARRTPRSNQILQALPRLEELESRVVPYTLSGNAWPNPQLITISFEPDGTGLGGVSSNLFATFNAKWATSTWENQILKAAQAWAQQTNINFAVVADSGVGIGNGYYQQGDPTMGDIRIGGYNFGTSTLAQAFMPPPANNYSVAGDIQFNTGQGFVINTNGGYDLYTVAVHEIGHALGLYHSSVSTAYMYAYYNGTHPRLTSDDVAGIQAIYSAGKARSYDSFGGTNNSFSTAANLTSLINGNGNVLENPLDIANTSLQEYFTITAPSNTNGTMTVTVQSSGLSLLAPTLTIYNSSQTQISYVSGAGQYGTTLTLNITGVSAGQQYYVKVAGADTSAFGTGNYGMTISFAGITPPAITPPNTQVLNGNPLTTGGGQPQQPGGGYTHGVGCDCPMCRGAAAAQQLLVMRMEIRSDHDNPGWTVAQTPSSAVSVKNKIASQAVTDVFSAPLASQLDSNSTMALSSQEAVAAAWGIADPDPA